MKLDPLFDLNSYDYPLPEGLIASYPVEERHESRLMVLNRARRSIEHSCFVELSRFLSPGDLLLLNDTRVFPARFFGRKEATGGKVEVVFLHFPQVLSPGVARVEVLWRASKPPKKGQKVIIGQGLEMEFTDEAKGQTREVLVYFRGRLQDTLETYGHVPLPPYIRRMDGPKDRKRYQTVFARETGSVAAPTAGLHFSEDMIKRLKDEGILIKYVTLHVGYGTFAPVREKDIRRHRIHTEWVNVPGDTLSSVREAKARGKRVVCVGTTTVRAMEYVFGRPGGAGPYEGPCDLYIYPGFNFRVTDAMITNFHLPRSSLLILVAAFAGLDFVLKAYNTAIKEGYRFYSYGDSMLIY